jgi:hypothetical protein
MDRLQIAGLLTVILGLGVFGTVPAQDNEPAREDSDASSQRTDESEEAYRRRMELEGARDRDTYSDQSYASQTEQDNLDKLPEKSQKNIRDQITDIIIENDQWEPGDVLEEYPYKPTEAAMKDPVLLEQEEEAWAEQVEKYHEREAAAFGATRPPMPGTGQQQAGTGSSGEGQQQGDGSGDSGQGGSQEGSQEGENGAGSAGGYAPNGGDDDEMSTAGVSESALDFLRGKQAQAQSSGGGGNVPSGQAPVSGPGGSEPQGQPPNLAKVGNDQQPESPNPSDGDSEQQAEDDGQTAATADALEQVPDGSLPIEQLEQLQGVAAQSPGGQPDTGPPPPGENQQSQTADAAATTAETEAAAEQEQAAQENQQAQQESESAEQTTPELDLSTPGIIAIRDLEKLEGVEEPPEQENPK